MRKAYLSPNLDLGTFDEDVLAVSTSGFGSDEYDNGLDLGGNGGING